jgi:hypothetical protein
MITPVAQRWRARRTSYRPAGEPINTRNYEVAEIADDATAKSFVAEHHYSASYPSARRRFGLFRNGRLVGVAIFSHPMSDAAITSVLPGKASDSVELGRFCLLDDVEANGESWMLARCREVLRREGFVGIISFSDDTPRTNARHELIFAGHAGTCYQASNATYAGRATPRTLRLLPDGRVFSDRAASKIRAGERGWQYASALLVGFGAAEPPQDDAGRRSWLAHWTARITRPLRHPGNHKYVWALQRGVRLRPSLPYPKLTMAQLQPVLF